MKRTKLKVQEVAVIAGISVRTLHHYDRIGLLSPRRSEESNYRLYDEDDLFRLQQILFYKEFDLSLNEIEQILNAPAFDRIEAMETHRKSLLNRQNRLNTLLETIDKTIDHLKNTTQMKDLKELYEGLPREFGTTFRKEAIDAYGKDEVDQSEKALMARGKGGAQELFNHMKSIFQKLKHVSELSPGHEVVQEYIADHHKTILALWGVTDPDDIRIDAYKGLANTYVEDNRFDLTGDGYNKRFAEFVRDGMHLYAEHLEQR